MVDLRTPSELSKYFRDEVLIDDEHTHGSMLPRTLGRAQRDRRVGAEAKGPAV